VPQFSCDAVKFKDSFDFIPEKCDPVTNFFLVCGQDVQAVSPYPECSGTQFDIDTLVMSFNKLSEERISAIDIPTLKVDYYPP